MNVKIFGLELSVKYLVLSIILLLFIYYNTYVSCLYCSKEMFESIDNQGANLNYKMGSNIKGAVYDLQFTNGQGSTLKDELKNIIPAYGEEKTNNKEKEINIYKDLETNVENMKNNNGSSINTISFFQNTKFSPDCCPSNYSSSSGCACITPEQMKFLNHRGGNRV